jgi:plastocyanin
MTPRRFSWSFLTGAMALGLCSASIACGGGGGGSSTGGPSSVTVISGSTGSVGPIGATVTITSAGVNPSTVTVGIGQSVTFVNSDTVNHQIASDPHPIHGSCPSIESGLGTLAPGQSRSTQGFAGAGRCTYHDHLNDGNRSLQGAIVIQ